MISFISKNIELSDLQVLLNLNDHGFEGMGIIDVASIKSCKKLVFTITSCLDARLNPSERHGRMTQSGRLYPTLTIFRCRMTA